MKGTVMKKPMKKGLGDFKLTKKGMKKYENAGRNWDGILVDGIPTFKPKDGRNQIRIMPPSWEGADHFAHDLWIHYVEIGGSRNQYLCHKNMGHEKGYDPIDEEQQKAEASGDKDYASQLKAKFRLAVYVIDRDNENEGPKLWLMPKTVNDQIVDQAVDDISGEILQVHDVEDGYDIVVTKRGSGLNTDYQSKIARSSSVLCNDSSRAEDWIDFIIENPIPECLEFKSYEHIHNTFHGVTAPVAEEVDEEDDEVKKTTKSTKTSLYQKTTKRLLGKSLKRMKKKMMIHSLIFETSSKT
jgi:hypothetical protein